jgi:hypothetical protein
MNPSRNAAPKPHRLALTLASALGFTLACTAASANPYTVGGRLALRHFPNLYNSSDGQPKTADTQVSTTLFGSVDQPLGRQRLYGNASISNNRYLKQNDYNNNSYQAGVGLDWSTIERISGNVNASVSQSLQDFGLDDIQVNAPQKNMYRTQALGGVARIGVVTRLTGELSYNWNKVGYSNALYSGRETSQSTWGAAVRYNSTPELSFGIGYRRGTGDLPNLGDSFTRDDIDLFVNYSLAGVHNFTGRVSKSKSEYDESTARNLDGTTASIYWNWVMTPKTSLTTSYSRDSGLDTAFINREFVPLQTDNSRVADIFGLRLNYQATAKINAYLDTRFTKRKLVTRVASLDIPGTEDQRNFAVGIGWTPTRSLGLGCDIGSLKRDLTGNLGDRTQSSTHYGCSVQFTLN